MFIQKTEKSLEKILLIVVRNISLIKMNVNLVMINIFLQLIKNPVTYNHLVLFLVLSIKIRKIV